MIKRILDTIKRQKPVFAALVLLPPVDRDRSNPLFSREILGKTLFQIMADRLSGIRWVSMTVFVTEHSDPQLIDSVNRLGWNVVSRRPKHLLLEDFLLVPSLLMTDYLAIFDGRYPFIDPEITQEILEQVSKEGLAYLYVKSRHPYTPKWIIKTRNAVFGIIRNAINGHKQGWIESAKMAAIKPYSRTAILEEPQLSVCLQADVVGEELTKQLGGVGFSIKELTGSEREPAFNPGTFLEKVRNRLYLEMKTSPHPYEANARLNRFERENGFSVVKSFPVDVALNLSGRCNANCRFCDYPTVFRSRPPENQHFSLDQVKRMTWLKYVSKLGLGGDLGDPLTHPQFLEVFRYLRSHFPHLLLRIVTNGIGLTEKVSDELVGHLTRLRVSLNAARSETWTALMGGHQFDQVCRQISYLSSRRKELKTTRPEIIILAVITRENIQEAPLLVEQAHSMGAQAVYFGHFEKLLMSESDLPITSSLYFAEEESDYWLALAQEKGKSLGIQVDRPPPFYSAKSQIFQSLRVGQAPEHCYFPWTDCYLGSNQYGYFRLNFCCVGLSPRISYKRDELDEANFIRTWNHPTLKLFRDTVNKPGMNPTCQICHSEDQADPGNQLKIEEARQEIGSLFQVYDDDFQSGC